MKIFHTILFIIISLISVFLLSSCEIIANDDEEITVTYVYGDHTESKTEHVLPLGFVRPDNPTRDGYVFVGWCTDKELTDFHSFSEPLKKSITLYAKWDIDYDYLIEKITDEALLSSVKVEGYTGNIFNPKKNTGSGVIVSIEDGRYYALTNAHVVKNSEDSLTVYKVFDAYANEYAAELEYFNAEYDLALLSFIKRSDIELRVAKIDERSPSKDEAVITVGSPAGKFNCYSFGNVLNYKTVEMNFDYAYSDIDFAVLWTDCYANHGSSGGAVYDTDLELIGIIFAIANEQSGEFKFSFAVPSNKINEFLVLAKASV